MISSLSSGLAFGYKPNRTLLVQVGQVRPFSDIYGRYEVRLTNDPARRQELVGRLRIMGCAVRTEGSDWLTIGNFNISAELKSVVPRDALTGANEGNSLDLP